MVGLLLQNNLMEYPCLFIPRTIRRELTVHKNELGRKCKAVTRVLVVHAVVESIPIVAELCKGKNIS